MEDKDKNEQNLERIQALRDMIYTAEKTLQGAKAMLLQLEGKKKVGRKKKVDEDGDGRIVEGTFDGQIMLGTDGKQYPVPANYASKSKLVEGDLLKLTITPDGSFIYKQIGPVERKRLIGTINQDADENYFIIAEGKPYRVLLASVTYFKVEAGDEVTLVTARDIDSEWGSIENVIQKGRDVKMPKKAATINFDDFGDEKELDATDNSGKDAIPDLTVLDEWAPDLEELKRELNKTDS